MVIISKLLELNKLTPLLQLEPVPPLQLANRWINNNNFNSKTASTKTSNLWWVHLNSLCNSSNTSPSSRWTIKVSATLVWEERPQPSSLNHQALVVDLAHSKHHLLLRPNHHRTTLSALSRQLRLLLLQPTISDHSNRLLSSSQSKICSEVLLI
jgi:hypothetical protein